MLKRHDVKYFIIIKILFNITSKL